MSGSPPPDLIYPYHPVHGTPGASFASIQSHPACPLALRREYYAGGDTGLHLHRDFFALYAVRGGRGIHVIDGHPYGISRGDVYLMPIGATHGYAEHHQLEIDAFYFKTELFSDAELAALRELPGFWSLFANQGEREHRLHLPPETWKQLELAVRELREEWGGTTAASALLFRTGFFRLLVWLARLIQEEVLPRGSRSEAAPNIAAALEYCERHYADALTVPQLAARIFLSPGHFSELFSREVGMPPAAYLRRLRLEKARTLLRETDLPAGQIALDTGFGDAAHFSRAFRAVYGVSPLGYRRSVERN